MLFEKIISEHKKAVESLTLLKPNLLNIFELSKKVLNNGKKIIVIGNGGSAADAQHFAAELTGRFEKNRKALSAIALTTDTSAITAIANDFGFEQIYSRQIEAIGNTGDILIAISTSGNSANIIQAIISAKQKGIICVGLLGNKGGKIKELLEHSIIVPSSSTARIQEVHLLIEHLWCNYLEEDY